MPRVDMHNYVFISIHVHKLASNLGGAFHHLE